MEFQKHLDDLYYLKKSVEDLRSELCNQLGKYIMCIRNLDGMAKEVAKEYELNFFPEIDKGIQRVIDNIEQNDLPYIIKEIRRIEG